MNREETARKFAEAMFADDPMRVTYETGDVVDGFDFEPKLDELTPLPKPDAPLHEHLAFVGRVAEALGDFDSIERFSTPSGGGVEWGVSFDAENAHVAADPSWAAMLAAIAAKAAR